MVPRRSLRHLQDMSPTLLETSVAVNIEFERSNRRVMMCHFDKKLGDQAYCERG